MIDTSFNDFDFAMPNMDPECTQPIPEHIMREDEDNYWDCPGCDDPNFYMGDPSCGQCGWNGR